MNTAKNLIESGDIKQTLKKSIEDSKQEVANSYQEILKLENNFKDFEEKIKLVSETLTEVWWLSVS